MPFFGNNVVSASNACLDDTLYGHFDAAFLASWGLPVPACIVNRVSVYAEGSPIAETSVLAFGIYDANVGTYDTWPLVATTPTVSIAAGAPVQWWSVNVNIPLAGGLYALSVLDVNGPALVCSANIRWLAKVVGMSQKSFAGGVFPDPLGIGTTTNQNYCLYADYEVAGGLPYTPTAACQC